MQVFPKTADKQKLANKSIKAVSICIFQTMVVFLLISMEISLLVLKKRKDIQKPVSLKNLQVLISHNEFRIIN